MSLGKLWRCAVAILAAVLTVGAVTVQAAPEEKETAEYERTVLVTEPEEVPETVYYYHQKKKTDPNEFVWVNGGVSGRALRLDGESDYVRLSTAVATEFREFTLSMWVYWQGEMDGNAAEQRLFTFYKNENRYITLMPHYQEAERSINGLYMRWEDRTIDPVELYDHATATTDYALELRQWHHIALVASDTEFTLYLDGTKYAGAPMNISLEDMDPRTFMVGGGFFREPTLNALLDEAYVYNKALTADEVAAAAQNKNPLNGETASKTTEYRATRAQAATTASATSSSGVRRLWGLPLPIFFIVGAVVVLFVLLSVVFSIQRAQQKSWKGDDHP